jgi:hypothetical protein
MRPRVGQFYGALAPGQPLEPEGVERLGRQQQDADDGAGDGEWHVAGRLGHLNGGEREQERGKRQAEAHAS